MVRPFCQRMIFSQVLADSTCLSALINDNNAVDYLVRSTTWASDVCGNSGAMSYIGLNNYASNTLLADSTWCSAICNSAYFESVLNVKVPVMTSNTTPSGVASASSVYSSASPAYYVFDKNSDTRWQDTNTSSNKSSWIDYQFTQSAKFYAFDVSFVYTSGRNQVFDFKIQGSANGTDYYDMLLVSNADVGVKSDYSKELLISNRNSYNHCRLYLDADTLYNGSTAYYSLVKELQFYGRADI